MDATSLPLSAFELCQLVRGAVPVDAARLNRVLAVDERRALVEVQANTTWRSLAQHLRPADARARETPTTCATIAESLACNAAGPDGRPTVSHVESLTLVTPDGVLRKVDRIANPGLFSLVIGGQGAFGALYSVTLRIESLARSVAEARAPRTLIGALARPARRLVLLAPPAKSDALILACRERCATWRIGLESLEVRRIRADEETFLRWAGREYDELALGLSSGAQLGAEVRLAQLRGELIDLAIACGGGFPIAGAAHATRAQTEACYPQLGRFLEEQRRIDPQQRWANGWLRGQRRLLSREACEVRWQRPSESA